jgi:hypothetical protein
MRGVHENNCRASVEFFPNRAEAWVAKVCCCWAVASEYSDSVRVEDVEGVCNFSEGCLGIMDTGKSGEESVGAGRGVADAGSEEVGVSGECCGCFACKDGCTRRGEREDSCFDAGIDHEFLGAFDGPGWCG